MEEVMERLDRIEQILREMGHCERCSYAHLAGITDCIDNGLTKIEQSMDRLIEATAPLAATPKPPRKRWWRRPVEW